MHSPPVSLFGLGQSKANQWIHVLLPALLAALRALGDAPARSLAALAQRLGVSEGALGGAPLEQPSSAAGPAATPVAGQAAPLLRMTERNVGLSVPRTRLNRPSVTAARKKTIP